MRFEEKCQCGGELVLVFESGRRHQYTSSESDSYMAREEIKTWRRRHKDCGKAPVVGHAAGKAGKDA